MTSLRARLTSVTAAAVVAALVLVGCSGGGSAGASTTPLPDDQQNLTFIPGLRVGRLGHLAVPARDRHQHGDLTDPRDADHPG